jgi:tRNA(fMet)-specific endonuclease VapC
MPTASGYLLDTNILLHLLRGKDLGQNLEQRFGLHSLEDRQLHHFGGYRRGDGVVRKFAWGQGKIAELKRLLDAVPWVDINEADLLAAYGDIDHFSESSGTAMGKNDVWIAATAHVTGMALLTTDGDFNHLHGKFLNLVWINPDTTKPA